MFLNKFHAPKKCIYTGGGGADATTWYHGHFLEHEELATWRYFSIVFDTPEKSRSTFSVNNKKEFQLDKGL